MEPANVLVVDDDAALARNVAALLAPLGVRTQIATSFADAVARARTTPFEVAVLDLVLPDGDGIAIVPHLEEHTPDAEVVFLTGQATLDLAAEAVNQRASAMLLKPVSPVRLRSVVQRALERRRSAATAFETRVRALRYRTLTRLCDGLAHELRNPLNAALLQLELVSRHLRRDGTQGSDQVLERFADARVELRRIAQTLTEFEYCVRPSALTLEPVPAADLVERVVTMVGPLARVHGVTIAREVEPGLTLEVDTKAMVRALANLAENGIEAMRAGGTLHVRARTTDGRIEIEVEDQGIGIPDPTAVFDPYYSTKAMGTGLGLNVVERVVADHQGTVAIRSRPGSTTFTLTFPAGALS